MFPSDTRRTDVGRWRQQRTSSVEDSKQKQTTFESRSQEEESTDYSDGYELLIMNIVYLLYVGVFCLQTYWIRPWHISQCAIMGRNPILPYTLNELKM